VEPSGQLKGNAFLWTLKFIDHHAGEGGRTRVLSQLEADERAILEGIVLPISWYPLPLFGRLLRAMDRELGKGDLSLAMERGRWVAVNDVRTIHKVFLKLFTPEWLVERATGSLWRKFHSSGEWTTEAVGEGRARAELRDLAHVDTAVCASIAGWMVGLFELAGAKTVDVRHPLCRGRGSAVCTYDVEWR
jgi:predicted hydrocarbon binding protein